MRTGCAERALVAADQRADLRDDFVLLAVLDLERRSARVERDELLRRRRHDLDGGVPRVHDVARRELEQRRGAADVHRFREHEAAEIVVVGGLPHDDAGRVRFACGGAGREVLGRLVAEVGGVEPAACDGAESNIAPGPVTGADSVGSATAVGTRGIPSISGSGRGPPKPPGG